MTADSARFLQLEAALAFEAERASRLRYPLGLLVISIDRPVPERVQTADIPHEALLSSIAHSVRPGVRRIDTVVENPGAGIAVILPGATSKSLQSVAYRLRVQVGITSFEIGNVRVRCTISIGGAVFPTHTHDELGLITLADAALVRAQEDGGDRTALHDQRP